MKTTTYTIAEAMKINSQILELVELQKLYNRLNASTIDLRFWNKSGDREMAEAEQQTISITRKKIKNIESTLTPKSQELYNQYNFYFVPGEGGRDRISIESI